MSDAAPRFQSGGRGRDAEGKECREQGDHPDFSDYPNFPVDYPDYPFYPVPQDLWIILNYQIILIVLSIIMIILIILIILSIIMIVLIIPSPNNPDYLGLSKKKSRLSSRNSIKKKPSILRKR